MSEQQQDELETLYPAENYAVFGEVVVKFSPVVVKNIKAFGDAVRPILQDARITDLFGYSLTENPDKYALEIQSVLEDLAIEYQPNVTQAILLCSDAQAAWLGEQRIDVLLALAQRVVEVNRNYFLLRVQPTIKLIMAQQAGIGLTPTQG